MCIRDSANGGAASLTAIGQATLTATGTATLAAFGTADKYNYASRVESLVTVAATTAVAGWRAPNVISTIGGASSGLGGFKFNMIGGPATGVATTTSRFYMGLSNSTAAPTDVEPSTITNTFGIGYDAADTNMQLMYRGAGAANKVDLGASFVVPTTDRSKLYRLELFSPSGTTQSVAYLVTDLISGATASGTITTNLPATSTLLCPRIWSSVGGTSSVVGVAFVSCHLWLSNY
jgi:hypothetical protein